MSVQEMAAHEPSKRAKNNSGRWRPGGASLMNTTPTRSISATTVEAQECRQTVGLEEDTATPSRSTHFDLVHDALAEHSDGLTSLEVSDWLWQHRPELWNRYKKQKLRTAIQATLSAQAQKKEPPVWKYKGDKSRGPGFIWKLANEASRMDTATKEQRVVDADVEDCVSKLARGPSDGIETSASTATAAPIQGQERVAPDGRGFSDVSNAFSLPNDSGTLPNLKETTTESPRGNDAEQTVSIIHADAADDLLDNSSSQILPTNEFPRCRPQTLTAISAQEESANESSADPTHAEQDALRDKPITETDDVAASSQRESPINEEHIRYGKLVIEVRELQRTGKQLEQEIEDSSRGLPNVDALKATAEEKLAKVKELEHLLGIARQEAESTQNDLNAAGVTAKRISFAKSQREKLAADEKVARTQLGIDQG